MRYMAASRRLRGFMTTLMLGWTLAACAAGPAQAPSAPVQDAGGDAAFKQLRNEIGDAACAADDQCHTLAVGHKACGGPEAYVAWSSAVSDRSRLQLLAQAYTDARRRDSQKAGRVSDCMMVTDPGARCDAGHCAAAQRPMPLSAK